MDTIASSATSVLIAHVAARTETIRLGSGGVMLPNHSPLVIAEQFGTLETLHPGRIDLGLGRADAILDYGEEFLGFRRGDPTPYMDALRFEAPAGDTADPDGRVLSDEQLQEAVG